jgi:hypothetical protein
MTTDQTQRCVAENTHGLQCANVAKNGEWCHVHAEHLSRRYTGNTAVLRCCPAPCCRDFGQLVELFTEPASSSETTAVFRWRCQSGHAWEERFSPHEDVTRIDSEMATRPEWMDSEVFK